MGEESIALRLFLYVDLLLLTKLMWVDLVLKASFIVSFCLFVCLFVSLSFREELTSWNQFEGLWCFLLSPLLVSLLLHSGFREI